MTRTAHFDFSGSTVLITGGGTGIGAGMARAFAAANANVVITGRRLEPLQQTAAEFPERISWVQMDVGIDADRRRTIEAVLERHGQLDVLINNAISSILGPFVERTQQEIATMYNVLLESSALLTQLALPQLQAVKGNVINISSAVSRSIPYPPMGLAVYASAKAGLNHLTRHLASELGPTGVRFNAIAPGVTMTEAAKESGYDRPEMQKMVSEHTPLRRVGFPADIANLALYLASDAASWVTGQVIDASGGWNLTP